MRRVLSSSAQIRTHPARQSSYLLVVVAGAGFAGPLPPLVAELVTHATRQGASYALLLAGRGPGCTRRAKCAARDSNPARRIKSPVLYLMS
jgi:hypothetical protein